MLDDKEVGRLEALREVARGVLKLAGLKKSKNYSITFYFGEADLKYPTTQRPWLKLIKAARSALTEKP